MGIEKEFFYKIKDSIIFIKNECYENCYFYGLQASREGGEHDCFFSLKARCFLFLKNIENNQRTDECIKYFNDSLINLKR